MGRNWEQLSRTEKRAVICILAIGAAVAALFCSGKVGVNISNSMPVGLWWRVDGPIRRGDIVEIPFRAFRSTDWVPKVYLTENGRGEIIPFLKRATGLPGDMVEAGEYGLIRVAGNLILNSAPLPTDSVGTPLPAYPLPLRLESGDVWLLSDSPRGLDSRYLGPAKLDECVKVVPLLVF